MEKNRIFVDGHWYIKEKPFKTEIKVDGFDFVGFCWETDLFSFEAIKIFDKNGELYDDFDIKFTDKRVKPFKEEYWDNMNWFKGVLENNPESIPSSLEIFGTPEELNEFVQFLKYLKEVKKWF